MLGKCFKATVFTFSSVHLRSSSSTSLEKNKGRKLSESNHNFQHKTLMDDVWIRILQLLNNFKILLNKRNHDRDSVWISDLNQHRYFPFSFPIFSLVFVPVEKIYQTLETVFDHICKHLDVRQKYSAVRRIFNSFLGVWKCGQTRSFVFNIIERLSLTFTADGKQQILLLIFYSLVILELITQI